MTVTALKAGSFKVQREGRPGHTVSVTSDGKRCDCPGFRYRRTCAHIDAVAQRRPAAGAGLNPLDIPEELRALERWVGWRAPKKIPLDVKSTRNASCSDRSTWSSFDEAVEWAQQCDGGGVGFEFAAEDGYVGIDLDGCRTPETGYIEGWACAIIARMGSYSEASPSGRGVHIFIKATKPGPKCRSGDGLEMYTTGRYFCMTGNRLNGSPETIEARQGELDGLYAEAFGDMT